MSTKDIATALSVSAHSGQKRRDGEPYVHHPMRVADMVDHIFPHDRYAPTVSILHDVVEDSNYTLDTLKLLGFNERVVESVQVLTREEGISRKAYIQNIFDSKNTTALRVKFCDAIDNSTWGYRDRFDIQSNPDAWLDKRIYYRRLVEQLHEKLISLGVEMNEHLLPRLYYVWVQIDRQSVKDFRLAHGEREAKSIHIGCTTPHAAIIDDIQYFEKGWTLDPFDVVIQETSLAVE